MSSIFKYTNEEILTTYRCNCYDLINTLEDINPEEIEDKDLQTYWYIAKNAISDLEEFLNNLEDKEEGTIED